MMVALRLIGLGWYIAICILLGTFVGVWLDGLLGMSPLFILLGLGLGLVASFFGLYRMVISFLGGTQEQ